MGTVYDPVHFAIEDKVRGYIRGYSHLACGLDSEMASGEASKLVRTISLSAVTCEWCKLALDKEKDKPVSHRELDERIVNMRFDNRGMSAHDTQKAITVGVEDGVAQSVARISKDFQEAQEPLKLLVADGVERALQRASVRTNLIGIHKIAEDEIDAEFDRDFPNNDEERQEEIRQALRDVLAEAAPDQTGAGVGTLVQNISSGLTARDVYEAVREAITDDEDETLEDYEENETSLMQKAVASIVTSDEFQELIKKVVKVSIEEDRAAQRQKELEYRERYWQLYFSSSPFWNGDLSHAGDIVEGSDHNPLDAVIQLPKMHLRRRFRNELHCGADWGLNNSTTNRDEVTCEFCKVNANIK